MTFKNRDEWRDWLKRNHDQESGIWMIFFKQGQQKVIAYESAIEEALCFGWIDSIIKKIDDQRYARKFTPRKESSKWSELNKNRVERLIMNGRMTDIGTAKIKAAQQSGKWYQPARPEISFDLPVQFKEALRKNNKAHQFFKKLAPSYQKQFIGWIKMAKRQETMEKRIAESVRLLEKGEKLGLR